MVNLYDWDQDLEALRGGRLITSPFQVQGSGTKNRKNTGKPGILTRKSGNPS
jgi:hypothetical protein